MSVLCTNEKAGFEFFVAPIRQFRRMIFLDFRYDTFDISVDTRTKVLEYHRKLTENLKEYNFSGEKMQATDASLVHILFLTASFFEAMK